MSQGELYATFLLIFSRVVDDDEKTGVGEVKHYEIVTMFILLMMLLFG